MSVNRAHNVTLQSSFLTLGGDLFVGSGIPGTNFDTATDSGDHLQFGLQVEHRQGAPYVQTGPLADGASWDVQSGTQVGSPTHAEWNFEWSVGVTNNHSIASVLALHDVWQQWSVDGQVFNTFKLVDIPASVDGNGVPVSPEQLVWQQVHQDGTNGYQITDDGHNPTNGIHVTQNSENIAFFLNDINAVVGANGPQWDLAQATATGHTYDVKIFEEAHGTAVQMVGVHPQMVEHAQIHLV